MKGTMMKNLSDVMALMEFYHHLKGQLGEPVDLSTIAAFTELVGKILNKE